MSLSEDKKFEVPPTSSLSNSVSAVGLDVSDRLVTDCAIVSHSTYVVSPSKQKGMESFHLDQPAKKQRLSISISAVLSPNVTGEVPLRQVIVATIQDKKEAAQLGSRLDPLPANLVHLKRIRSHQGVLQIILGPRRNEYTDISEDLKHYGIEDEVKFKGIVAGSCEVLDVASQPPVSRKQFTEMIKLWPCNFHPDKDVEKALSSNSGFTSDELTIVSRNTSLLLEASLRSENTPVCVVYDEERTKGVLVCTGGTPTSLHPVKHCVMEALDRISIQQGGKRWDGNEFVLQPAHESNFLGNSFRESECYLCTGFDVYLVKEPCIMCAMALLHSRVRRVFFVEASPNVGALESVVQLQFLPGINHRFQVFKVHLA